MSWPTFALTDIGKIVGGGTPSTKDPDNFGSLYPWITPKDMSRQSSRFISAGERGISEKGLTSSSAKIVPAGTILISSRAPIGLTAIAAVPVTTNQGCRNFIPDGNADSLFMYYLLSSMTEEFDRHANGSTFREISGTSLGKLQVSLPPIKEQRGIAHTLGALDDKIESNLRLIELIPYLIRARVTEALASSTRQVAVSELASFVNGGAYTKGASGTGRLVIRIADLNSGPGGSTVYSDIDVPDDKTARPGDILMPWSGSLGVYRWFRDEAIINQHIFKVIPAEGFPDWLVFDRLQAVMPVFQGIAKDKATTMGHIQRGHLKSTAAAMPSADSIVALDQALDPLWRRLLVADRESVRLAQLRDTLVPELLSGRIRVTEAAECDEVVA